MTLLRNWVIGDVVQLKSGGMRMTVSGFGYVQNVRDDTYPATQCIWATVDHKLLSELVPDSVLMLAASDKKTISVEAPLDVINWSQRARKAFSRLQITSIGDLVTKTASDILATKNCGQSTLTEIRKKLLAYGFSLSNDLV